MRYLIAAAVLGLAGSTFADIINVPADYATIQAAVDAAVGGDEVVVAPGTYTGTGAQVVNMLGKAITLRASGAPEETIIDGEGARRGIACFSGETSETGIEGFTITGGSQVEGGGVYCVDGSSPTLTDCTISDNIASQSGGGIYCYNNSSPTLTECTISGNNVSSYNGGGIYCYESSNPTLTDCTISNNTASYRGGGIYCNDSNPTLTDCTISNNTAFHWDGGGIYCNNSSPTITSCTISGNTSIGYNGGGICCENSSSPTITNCTISGNQAAWKGGGIGCYNDGNPTITDCTITGNVAIEFGGGIYVDGSFPTLTNTHVCGNVSDQIYGVWNDNGGNEINEVCPDFVGACCTGNQSWCVAASEADCEYFGGVFMGYGVQCADVSCPTTCLGDVNADGEVSINDLLTVIANWGPCP